MVSLAGYAKAACADPQNFQSNLGAYAVNEPAFAHYHLLGTCRTFFEEDSGTFSQDTAALDGLIAWFALVGRGGYSVKEAAIEHR